MDILIAVFSVVAGCLCTRLGRNIREKFLCFVAVFLPLSETAKQIYLYSINGFYEWWYFPFQLCSIPMYLMPLRCLSHSEKLKEYADSFLVIYGLFAGFVVFADTSGFVYKSDLLTIHSYIWHILMIVTAIIIYSLGECEIQFTKGMTVYCVCAVIRVLLNVILHTKGSIDMFYISPHTVMNQIVFKQIGVKFDQIFAKLFYIIMTNVGAFVVYLVLRKTKKVLS